MLSDVCGRTDEGEKSFEVRPLLHVLHLTWFVFTCSEHFSFNSSKTVEYVAYLQCHWLVPSEPVYTLEIMEEVYGFKLEEQPNTVFANLSDSLGSTLSSVRPWNSLKQSYANPT
jgi:hypothetical protein